MLVQPEQVSSFRFSTADLPAHERRNAIRQVRERGLLPIEPLPDNVVSGQINKCFLPGAGILSGTLCGVRQEGNLQAIDASDDLFFAVNTAGRSTALQRDNASAATVEPIRCTIRTFRRRSPIAIRGVRNVANVKATVDVQESEARESLQSQMPTASVTSDDLCREYAMLPTRGVLTTH
jgi:hypothetical protein